MCQVMPELTFLNQIVLFSDKCNEKDIQKLEQDYKRDLEKRRFDTKSHLQRYLKVPDKPIVDQD